jgi:hypothetical protein
MTSEGTVPSTKVINPFAQDAEVKAGALEVAAAQIVASGDPGCVVVVAGSVSTATLTPVRACPVMLRVEPSNLKNAIVFLYNHVMSGYTHGRAGGTPMTPERRAYFNAKTRCTNPNDKKRWNLYGGRGIKFQFQSFEQFLSCVGLKPTPKHMLDRIDSDGHYAPGNVRWSTVHEQMLNRRMTPIRHKAICRNLVIARKNVSRDPITHKFTSHQR